MCRQGCVVHKGSDNGLLLRSPTCCFSKRCCVIKMDSVSTTPTAWMDVDYSKSQQSGRPSTTSSAKSRTPTTNITGYRWKSGSLNQWNSCMNLVLSFFFNLSLRLLALYNCKKDNTKRLHNTCIYSYTFNFVEVQFQRMNTYKPVYSICWMQNGNPMTCPLFRKLTSQPCIQESQKVRFFNLDSPKN